MSRPSRQTRQSRRKGSVRPSPGARRPRSGAARARVADRALITLAEAATAGLTPLQMLDLVVAAAAALTGDATVHLWLVDDDRRELRLVAESGGRRGKAGVDFQPRIKVGEGLVGDVARRRQPTVLTSLRGPKRVANAEWIRDQGFASFAGVPFARADRLLGVLSVFTWRRHRFTRHDVDLLRSFASHAAVALESAALFEAATSRLRRLETLREIEREISQQRDPDALLGLIVRRASELLEGSSATVFLLDEVQGLLRPHASYEAPPGLRAVAIGEGVAGRVALRREGMIVNDYPRSPYAIAPYRDVDFAVLAQPLLVGTAIRGVILVRRRSPGREFADADLIQLGDFAIQASIALENARLFAQTRTRQQSAETLAALTQTLTGSLDTSTVLSLVADGVRRLLGSDGGAVGLAEPDGAIRLTTAVGLGADAFRDLVVRPGQGVGGRVLETQAPFWTTDYLHDPRLSADFAEKVRAAGLVAELAVPIRVRDELVGVLWAIYGRTVEISGEDIGLASDLAQVVAIAVENARLYDEARQSAAEARTLFEVGRLIAATLDPDRVLDVIVEKARGLMGAPACGLFQLDAEGEGQLRYARGAGLSEGFVEGLTVRLGEGTSGRSVADGVPVWSEDLLADSRIPLDPATRALVEKEGYRAVLSVPVWIKEAPYGCLATYWWEPRVLTPREVERLSSLATLAAVALENARLYAEAREHVDRLERLNQVNRSVSASLRLDEVLGQVAQAVASLLRAPVVTVWVADEERRVLVRRADYGDPALLAVVPERRAYGEGGVGWVAAHRQPLLDVPVGGDARILRADALLAHGITSITSVPIVLGERLLGVLSLGSRRESPLAVSDRAVLQMLVGQAAVAIENARLYETAQRQEAEAVALSEASRRFSATLRRESVLEALVEAAERVLGQQWVVFVVEAETGALRVAARAGKADDGGEPRGPELDSTPVRVGERLTGQVAVTGVPLLLRDLAELPADHPSRPDMERWGMRSVLIVPVVASGAVRAILAGSIHDDSRQFSERDLRLAQAVADRAATALENARLFEELNRAYQELKTAQEHLVQTEKLRALGEMASGVAHDFNNILAAILGRVQLILNHTEEPTLRRWLQVIERAALDGAQTVRQIQEFTRIRRDQPAETVDLNDVVRDAVEMTQTRWRDQTQSQGLEVRLVTELAALPPVDGHPAELRQVLTNLILNAVDALLRGGTITVTTRTASGAVEVSVADTGVGMSDEVRRRIFEPFFTTKGPKGTGLGLAMVYGIVARHGGEVAVESQEGAGATVTIRLPVGSGRADPGTAPLALAGTAGARVLVIDDEQPVRDALADMLRLTQHDVVAAAHGAEGLERFRAAPFDLVMTDLAMPGMSGWQVAQAVKKLRPEVPVVLVTGWGVELPADQLRANGVDRVMTKPFRIDEVNAVVAAFLGRAPQRS